MVQEDETALICDFAETYGVLDWKALPLRTAAALASGLRDDSRIKMRLAGVQADQETLLLAAAVDRLSLLLWAKTKDAEKGRNRPISIFDKLTGQTETEETDEFNSYDSPDAFMEAWKRATGNKKEV